MSDKPPVIEAEGRMLRPMVGIRILIVEDDERFASIAVNLIQPIMKAFPGSSVLHVKTIDAALVAVSEMVAPDITLLDLTLPPSNLQDTLAHLDTLEDRTAVVIVTGHSEEEVRRIIGQRPTPVVLKSLELMEKPSALMTAIYIAVDAFQNRKWARWRENLQILKGVTTNPAFQTSTGPPTDAQSE